MLTASNELRRGSALRCVDCVECAPQGWYRLAIISRNTGSKFIFQNIGLVAPCQAQGVK